MQRVRALMRAWAQDLGLPPREVDRWAAAGLLHDALREAEPESLRPLLAGALAALPGPVLHGPAAAQRLAAEGVADASLIRAVAFHTLGHPEFDALGMALSAADFLEPGRTSLAELRDPLRNRMPGELRKVIREIMAARLRHLLARGQPVSDFSIHCWNALVESDA